MPINEAEAKALAKLAIKNSSSIDDIDAQIEIICDHDPEIIAIVSDYVFEMWCAVNGCV